MRAFALVLLVGLAWNSAINGGTLIRIASTASVDGKGPRELRRGVQRRWVETLHLCLRGGSEVTESATTGVQIGEEEMELAGPQSQWGNLEVQGAAEGKKGEISASEKASGTATPEGDAIQGGMDQSDDDFSVGGGQDDGDDEVSGVGGAKGVQGQGSRYETVDCRFERIGDTNGVIYYLGARHAEEQGVGKVVSARSGTRRIFVNPAKTGRVKLLSGPMRCMCTEKMIGRSVQPEDVLQRNVVGDEFWFPDGFFAIDLGNHTTLRPTHYMMRNGGAKGEVVTGWVLEAATQVEGQWWRVGDWQPVDQHVNSSAFDELAEQVAGYTHETGPPTKPDPRTGQPVCTIPRQLFHSWQPTPIGEKPHHTLCFRVQTPRFFRFFRLRLLTHKQHTHFEKPVGSKNLHVQGFELYGQLRIGEQQKDMPLFNQSCHPAQWYFGLNEPELWEKDGPTWEMQWLRDKEDQKEWDIETSMLREQYIKRLKEIAYARPPDREDDELTKLVQKYGKDALDEYKLEMEEKTDEEKAEYMEDAYESGE